MYQSSSVLLVRRQHSAVADPGLEQGGRGGIGGGFFCLPWRLFFLLLLFFFILPKITRGDKPETNGNVGSAVKQHAETKSVCEQFENGRENQGQFLESLHSFLDKNSVGVKKKKKGRLIAGY